MPQVSYCGECQTAAVAGSERDFKATPPELTPKNNGDPGEQKMSHAPLDLPHALVTGYSHMGSVRNADLFNQAAYNVTHRDYVQALRNVGTDSSVPISVCVHIPFCPVRCFTCENNTQVIHEPAEIDRYLDSLEREIGMVVEHAGTGRRLGQLHLGGGSPSFLNDSQLAKLIAMLERHFQIDDSTDTSIKVNPKYTSAAQLALLSGFGFRHIILNLSDLDPHVQLAIGRVVSFELVQDVVNAARDVGFDVVSSDLMYGLPAQTQNSLETTILRLLDLTPDRVNCVAYTRQVPTMAHQHAIDPHILPSSEDKQALFDMVVNTLSSSGYTWIGLDCFARSGDALCMAQQQRRLCKNWTGYTAQPTPYFVGFGANAIIDLQSTCVQNHVDVASWSDAIAKGSLPIRNGVQLSSDDCRRRAALMKLMCNMELHDYAPLFAKETGNQTWNRYARDGFLDITPERLTITEQGRYLFHQILSRQTTAPMAFDN